MSPPPIPPVHVATPSAPPHQCAIHMHGPPERQPPRPLVSRRDPILRAHLTTPRPPPPLATLSAPQLSLSANFVREPQTVLLAKCFFFFVRGVVCVGKTPELFPLLNSPDTVSKQLIMSHWRRDVSILLIRSWKPDIHIKKAVLGAAGEGQ